MAGIWVNPPKGDAGVKSPGSKKGSEAYCGGKNKTTRNIRQLMKLCFQKNASQLGLEKTDSKFLI